MSKADWGGWTSEDCAMDGVETGGMAGASTSTASGGSQAVFRWQPGKCLQDDELHAWNELFGTGKENEAGSMTVIGDAGWDCRRSNEWPPLGGGSSAGGPPKHHPVCGPSGSWSGGLQPLLTSTPVPFIPASRLINVGEWRKRMATDPSPISDVYLPPHTATTSSTSGDHCFRPAKQPRMDDDERRQWAQIPPTTVTTAMKDSFYDSLPVSPPPSNAPAGQDSFWDSPSFAQPQPSTSSSQHQGSTPSTSHRQMKRESSPFATTNSSTAQRRHCVLGSGGSIGSGRRFGNSNGVGARDSFYDSPSLHHVAGVSGAAAGGPDYYDDSFYHTPSMSGHGVGRLSNGGRDSFYDSPEMFGGGGRGQRGSQHGQSRLNSSAKRSGRVVDSFYDSP